MMIQLKTLLSLAVSHDYYGGVCKDVRFVIPEDVSRSMRGALLLVKIVEGVLHVLYRADEDGAPIVSAAGTTLRIGLSVQDPRFANITEGFAPADGVLHYRNATAPGKLDAPAKVALAGSSLSRALSAPARPVTVTLRDASGRALRAETITTQNDRSAVSFDLTGVTPGACGLEEIYPGGVSRTSAHYVDPELRREAAFGVIELRIDSGFYAAAPAFEVSFRARRETLKYYLVARGFTNGDVDHLSVQDNGFMDQGRPEVRFVKVPPSEFTPAEISADLLGGRDAKVLLFKSESPVARQENGRKKIQLMRNSEVMIEHLPQPGADRATTDLIVHLSKS
ncbi:hypothetical protein [Sorangium sp. So ce385]|uniref:hypothetical protein n=1 Tax=Sorangium sp. So ce385 TaxID=3133308 RepID=UPI003F5C443B